MADKKKAVKKEPVRENPFIKDGYDLRWLKEVGEEHPDYARMKEKHPEMFK